MHQLRIRCPLNSVDLISDTLMEWGALSVSTQDADADTQDEQALYGEPGMPAPATGWNANIVLALFPDETSARNTAAEMAAHGFFTDAECLDVEPVPDQDWVRITQAQFDPIPITDSFWIVPSWHERPEAATTVIQLDPGVAFGTGTHPTTRMCLRWIAQHPERIAQQRVMDYGCGSGILAIAAALHKAEHVDAVDIDASAIEATNHNSQTNHVTIHAQLASADAPRAQYDVVIANILATPLKVLAPLLAQLVKPGGHLLLAGILERQNDELQAAYAEHLPIHAIESMDGWILMHGQKPSTSKT